MDPLGASRAAVRGGGGRDETVVAPAGGAHLGGRPRLRQTEGSDRALRNLGRGGAARSRRLGEYRIVTEDRDTAGDKIHSGDTPIVRWPPDGDCGLLTPPGLTPHTQRRQRAHGRVRAREVIRLLARRCERRTV